MTRPPPAQRMAPTREPPVSGTSDLVAISVLRSTSPQSDLHANHARGQRDTGADQAMTTRQREKRLAHLRKLGRITPGMEWCLRDRGRGMDRQYHADQIGLLLNQTLNLARMLGLVDAKTKAMMVKQELNAAMRNCKEPRCKRDRQMVEMRSTGASQIHSCKVRSEPNAGGPHLRGS